MNVYLAKKDGAVIFHTDLSAMEQMDGISKPDETVTIEEWEANGNTAYIDASGDIKLGEPPTVVVRRKEIEALEEEAATLQCELDNKDYKVIKAAEVGAVLSETDPPLHTRRDWCRSRINEIRDRLAILQEAAAA